MSEQTTVHLRWTVPCSLAHTADTHGTWNELQSDLPRCMRAQGLAYLRVTRLVKGLLRCLESSARSALAILHRFEAAAARPARKCFRSIDETAATSTARR